MKRRNFISVLAICTSAAGCSSQSPGSGQSDTPHASDDATQSPTESRTPSPSDTAGKSTTESPTETSTETETETPDPSIEAQEDIDGAKESLREAIDIWEGTKRNSSFSAAVTAESSEFDDETILSHVQEAGRSLDKARRNADEDQKSQIEGLSATTEFLKWSTRAWPKAFPVYKKLQSLEEAYYTNDETEAGSAHADDLKDEVRSASSVVERAISEADELLEIGVPDFSHLFNADGVKTVKGRLGYTLSVSKLIAQNLPKAYGTISTYNSGVSEYDGGSLNGAEGDFIQSKSGFRDAQSSVSDIEVKFAVGQDLQKFQCFVRNMYEASVDARTACEGESRDDEYARRADDHVSSLENCDLQLPVSRFF